MNVRIECELAVRLGRDLPKGPQPHTRESVRAAVSEIMAAFELIEDRNADYKSSKALSLIADNAWNGGIVLGAGKAPPAGSDLNGIAGRLLSNGTEKGCRQDRRSHGRAGVGREPRRRPRPAHHGRHGGDHRQRRSPPSTSRPASASTSRSTASATYR